MNYFVMNNLTNQLTGNEYAQLERYQVFKTFASTPSKLVSLVYDRFSTQIKQIQHLTSDELINMWDYLQGIDEQTLREHPHEVAATTQIGPGEEIVERTDQVWTISNGAFVTKKIYLLGNPFFNEQIDYIDFFDRNNNAIRRDYYDVRGFKSMTNIYGHYGGVARQVNYNLDGRQAVESLYQRNAEGDVTATQWIISDVAGRPLHSFKHSVELQAYFLDRINAQVADSVPNTFIIDRADMGSHGLLAMKSVRQFYIYWSRQLLNDQVPTATQLAAELANNTKVTGVVATDPTMYSILQADLADQIPVYQVNAAPEIWRQWDTVLKMGDVNNVLLFNAYD